MADAHQKPLAGQITSWYRSLQLIQLQHWRQFAYVQSTFIDRGHHLSLHHFNPITLNLACYCFLCVLGPDYSITGGIMHRCFMFSAACGSCKIPSGSALEIFSLETCFTDVRDVSENPKVFNSSLMGEINLMKTAQVDQESKFDPNWNGFSSQLLKSRTVIKLTEKTVKVSQFSLLN